MACASGKHDATETDVGLTSRRRGGELRGRSRKHPTPPVFTLGRGKTATREESLPFYLPPVQRTHASPRPPLKRFPAPVKKTHVQKNKTKQKKVCSIRLRFCFSCVQRWEGGGSVWLIWSTRPSGVSIQTTCHLSDSVMPAAPLCPRWQDNAPHTGQLKQQTLLPSRSWRFKFRSRWVGVLPS